jgi:hypothetical protein
MENPSRHISRTRTRPKGQNAIILIIVLTATTLIASALSLENLITANANAQEDKKDVTEEEQSSNADEEIANLTEATVGPNGISQRLDYAHFVPMSPVSNSPGNQLKILLDYTVDESSPLLEEPISAVMEVYAENGTLLRTSSLPEPIVLHEPEGTVQLATTFDDKSLESVTALALLTDETKGFPISDPLETRLNLGERRTTDTQH